MKCIEDRFWGKVDIGEEDECWPWLACRNPKGYGMFGIDGRMYLAHRVAWALVYGEVPERMCICHHCDNPSCCNPGHLFLGTQADNLADMTAKGRHRDNRGELCGRSKLTEADVLEIRRLWDETYLTQPEIGAMFGVAQNTISNIVRDKSWTHI